MRLFRLIIGKNCDTTICHLATWHFLHLYFHNCNFTYLATVSGTSYYIHIFHFSALQLEDENEDIHLSLSPSASPIPDETVFDDIDLNSSSKTTATNEVPQVPAGLSKYAVGVGYRDVKSAPTRPTSMWDSMLGCLKPVMSLMNKSGKPSNLQKSEKGNSPTYVRFSKNFSGGA